MAKTEGSFWSRTPVRLGLGLAAFVLAGVAGAVFLLYGITHPPRDRTVLDPADLLLRAEEITFTAGDGVILSGWMVKGAPGSPAIILCHDLGGSRFSLLSSAVSLNRAGYPLLVFDFRGHGSSGAGGATLGVNERLDLLAAVAHLKERKDIDTGRIGVWGTGMGAYAAALAAADTPEIVALALDSVYPDVAAQLDRLVRARVPPALHGIVPAIRLLYEPYFAFRLAGGSVARTIESLKDRNVMFIAGADVPERHAEERRLYAALPESPAGSKNLLELNASGVSGLYDEDKKRYDREIVAFFAAALPRGGARPGPSARAPIRVIER